MEFYQEVVPVNLSAASLKVLLSIEKLTTYCASITEANVVKDNIGQIYCIWGAFTVQRVELKQGVCFILLNCPHALTWSITLNTTNDGLTIHCTIDKKETDQDFIESIQYFLADWSAGLAEMLMKVR